MENFVTVRIAGSHGDKTLILPKLGPFRGKALNWKIFVNRTLVPIAHGHKRDMTGNGRNSFPGKDEEEGVKRPMQIGQRDRGIGGTSPRFIQERVIDEESGHEFFFKETGDTRIKKMHVGWVRNDVSGQVCADKKSGDTFGRIVRSGASDLAGIKPTDKGGIGFQSSFVKISERIHLGNEIGVLKGRTETRRRNGQGIDENAVLSCFDSNAPLKSRKRQGVGWERNARGP